MKKYTKAERHEIYKQSLKHFMRNSDVTFLCHTFKQVIGVSNSTDGFRKMLPEFDLFAPSDAYHSIYWYPDRSSDHFNVKMRKPRIIALLFMIEMTKP